MRHSAVLATFAVLALCVPFIAVLDSGDSEAADGKFIVGYVTKESNNGDVGLSGAIVSIREKDSSGNLVDIASATATSDSTGKFSISAADLDMTSMTTYYIHIDYGGYTVRSFGLNIDPYGDSGNDNCIGEIGTLNPLKFDSDGNYWITPKTSSHNCILMYYTAVTTTINVFYDGHPIADAKITLESVEDDSVIKYGKSDDNGVCEINNVNVGMYKMTIDAAGFKEYTETIDVPAGGGFSNDYVLTEKTHATYLGLNLVHLFMTIGIALGLSMAIGAWLLYHHSNVAKSHVDKKDLDDIDGPKE